MNDIRFDDLEAIAAAVTDEWGPWGAELEVTQHLVDAYADLSGDDQWIHVDVERSRRESPYGGPIAHGFLTLSVLPRLDIPRTRLTGYGSAVNYGVDSLRFIAPVPVGASIHGRSRLLGAEPKGAGVLVTTELQAAVVDADRPALVYRGLALHLP